MPSDEKPELRVRCDQRDRIEFTLTPEEAPDTFKEIRFNYGPNEGGWFFYDRDGVQPLEDGDWITTVLDRFQIEIGPAEAAIFDDLPYRDEWQVRGDEAVLLTEAEASRAAIEKAKWVVERRDDGQFRARRFYYQRKDRRDGHRGGTHLVQRRHRSMRGDSALDALDGAQQAAGVTVAEDPGKEVVEVDLGHSADTTEDA